MWDGSGFQSRKILHFRVIAKKPIYSPYFTIILASIFKSQVNLSIIVEEVNVGAYSTPWTSQITYKLQGPTQWCSETPKNIATPIFHVARLVINVNFHIFKVVENFRLSYVPKAFFSQWSILYISCESAYNTLKCLYFDKSFNEVLVFHHS